MKNILIGICKAFLHVFFLFPVKKDRIFFSAYSGKSYSCNPKYITQALCQNAVDCEIIWAFIDPGLHNLPYKTIKKVRFKSIRYLYYLLTSALVVDNVESWSILPKRKDQFVINTWHGGGSYKGVGLKRRDADASVNANMLKKNERIDLYLSSSKAFTEMTLRDSFGYRGDVIECGMPRNDILIEAPSDKAAEIRKQLGINKEERLVLYAPTFRADPDYSYDLDADRILEALALRFGGSWRFLFRAHYYTNADQYCNKNISDVTEWEDMQELLLISDVLITDYSSSIWDFSLMKKPCFLYTPDLNKYSEERDFYTPISEWPYPYAEDIEDLCQLIRDHDEETAVSKILHHHEALQNMESGRASEAVCSIIKEKLEVKNA